MQKRMGRVSPVRGNLKSPDAASRLKRKRTSGGLCMRRPFITVGKPNVSAGCVEMSAEGMHG
ncbi:MAG: hypothetical protein V1875_01480 [Candidatus Altiarchaeota archaeon]